MNFKIDSEHIFFDRFNLTDKRHQAEYIITKALDEIGSEFSIEDDTITINEENIEKVMKIKKLTETLKHEFFILLSPIPKEEKSVNTISLIDKSEAYIRQNYLYETLTVTEICENAAVSRGVLDAVFIKEHNLTVSEYIRALRVEAAKKLLKEGYPMEECAQLAGFGSVKTMQRAFRLVYGTTPGEYRASRLDSNGEE